MEILIAGAGICGLTAATALRHQGHHVTLFEQSKLASESGAAIFLPPNANGLLRSYGLSPEKLGANQYRGTYHFSQDGKLTLEESFNGDEFHAPWDLIRRSSLHEGLKQLALDPEGPGPAAKLYTASRVISVDTEQGSVWLEDGSVFRGDVILGADGSHSKTREYLDATSPEGSAIAPFSSGKNCFRFLIDRAKLKDNPSTKIYEHNGCLVAWFGDGIHLVSYPCERDKVINFVAIHPDHLSHAKNNDYDSAGSKENLQSIFGDFEPSVQTIMQLVEESSVKLYPLNDMATLPTFVKGRLALLGDAAHPFLPYLGQGGAQAIEDSIAIGVMLNSDVTREQVSKRLKLYEYARKTRVDKVQEATRQTGSGLADAESFDFDALRLYNYNYDELANSQQVLRQSESA